MNHDAIIQTFGEYHEIETYHVRTEVAMFAIEMERVLEKNDHKSGWEKLDIDYIFSRIQEEVDELEEACTVCVTPSDGGYGDASPTASDIQNMRNECVDIANYCMFLCHNYPAEEK